ncbi:tRNA (guanosine(46)-N7)-methyltransferase TrmB [Kovacikia minuta CCNUW1]|uniref:tRNA (guanosine(46)-N7)-methyltransferase TrmB n=1 Tax=Kovacikia minuta TaxID=2931930 RepID=UPI001CCC12DD|nr:tRNA (guanosine(46)-N7)-methyltransferase TrmB [Kovacikia minuta]UBF26578.1 tRNA (guanosine(46)-N7)-methyltransferase TrmB [Kovacikia minuta CCNUW1]
MAIVRVREHVNPLSKKYQVPISPPDWQKIYAVPSQSLHLDIGSGKGRFLLEMAQQRPDWNFLGLEIREPLVDQANGWCREMGLSNLYYLFCNVNNSLSSILHSIPAGALRQVTIQFPDPWFKRKHQKRRVVQPEIVAELADALCTNGMVLIQSDVEEVAVEMRDRFDAHPAFIRHPENWLDTNPLPVPTEREVSTLKRGEPVYRAVFIKLPDPQLNRQE